MNTMEVLRERLYVVLDQWCDKSRELGQRGLDGDHDGVEQALLQCQRLRIEAQELRDQIREAKPSYRIPPLLT